MFVIRLTFWDLRLSNSYFVFLRIHIWLIPLLEWAVWLYFWRPCLICVSSFVSRMGKGLVEHFDEPAINPCLYMDFCASSKPNPDAEKSVRLYVGFSGSEMQSKFLDQDVNVVFLENKGVVIGGFVSKNYNKILMKTGKFHRQHHGHDKWTRIWCWQNVKSLGSALKLQHKSTSSILKECRLRHPLSWPIAWHTLHMHPR